MRVQTLCLGPISTNCYILTSDSLPGHALVIDPAYDGEAIAQTLEKSFLVLDAVLLTHCHFDHFEGLDALLNATGASLFCPLKDEPGLTDPFYNASMIFYRYPVTSSARPARSLSEKDVIAFGSERLTVIETPGHTPGSVSYLTGDLLFSGDTLFLSGCGRTDLPGGDDAALAASLDRLMRLCDLCDLRVYPGHGDMTRLADERRHYGGIYT